MAENVVRKNPTLDNPLQFKGSIALASEFPTSAAVETGWFYRVTADVTDNDGSKTNTGQSFTTGDEIAWNGTDWTILGNENDFVPYTGATGTVNLNTQNLLNLGNVGIGTATPNSLLQIVGQGTYKDIIVSDNGMMRMDQGDGTSITTVHPFVGCETGVDASSPAYKIGGDTRNLSIGGKNGVRVHALDAGTDILISPTGFVVPSGFFIGLTSNPALTSQSSIWWQTDVTINAREDIYFNINGGTDKTAEFTIQHNGTTVFRYNNTTDDFQISPDGTDTLFIEPSQVGVATSSPTSTLHIEGSLTKKYVGKTTTYTATASDYLIDCTSGTFTVTLPTASGITGREYVIKNSGTGTITIDGDGSETIDGDTTKEIIEQYVSITVMSDGTNWKIV